MLALLTLVWELSGVGVLIFGAISLDGSFECLHRLLLGVVAFVGCWALEILIADKLRLIVLAARSTALRIAAHDLLLLNSGHILLILVACLGSAQVLL